MEQMTKPVVSLSDKYRFETNPYYITGTQSLVRLLLLEKQRRVAQGANTAVYLTGYRGSPLASLDQATGQAAAFLGPDIVHQPAINEDLAATAVWGTQQLGTFGSGRYSGVSAAWYGKGPGVDRSGDAFKHGNLAGSAAQGGVLVIAGDDHTSKSSTTAHQSEYALIDAMIPVLAPASIAEQIEFGLIGWEMSRYSGLWAGLKVVTEIMDSSETVCADPLIELVRPDHFRLPEGGLSLRWPDMFLAQEERLHRFKIPAALSFAQINRLDRVVFGAASAWLGIITTGKAHADTLEALAELGIDEARAISLGIRCYKVAMPWPLEPEGVRAFARGLADIVVVEEKRGLIEEQVRSHLYGMADPPVIVGKRDDSGSWLFPSNGELGTGTIAIGLARRIVKVTGDEAVRARLADVEERVARLTRLQPLAQRPPHFCPGCPHNSSTKLPQGSQGFAGIGCHFLVQSIDRETAGYTQMGGEGANWIGLSPFSSTKHMFQNIGDGTYFHSGSLAIRAAIAAGVNITYKILFNGAVAMTGGQPVDGELTLARVVAQVAAEGAKRIVVVSDEPQRHFPDSLPPGVSLLPREELDTVQRELRATSGVSILIYDQTCATELRRMRKRGKAMDPKLAIVINDLVCEGCGDCSQVSNCLAVVPVETEFGRKRAVDLSTCNKDTSCLGGFCPSFVTVEGGTLRKPALVAATETELFQPTIPALEAPFRMVVTGIGGTGVVTIGAIIGMAAHMDGLAVRVMDMTGLAQKGGAVVSHIQLAPRLVGINAAKVSAGAADLMLACDLIVGASPDNLGRVSREFGHIIANDHENATGAFTLDPEFAVPVNPLKSALIVAVAAGRAAFCDATDLATRLVGDSVGANLFMVGFAWQRGLLPVSLASLERAVELNGVAVALNHSAFAWGRRAALDLAAVQEAASGDRPLHHALSVSVEETVARRATFLTEYQDAAYARRYSDFVDQVRRAELAAAPGQTALTAAVAKSLFRLMAYKDEYEVARLYAETSFIKSVKDRFEGPFTLGFHMAPPLLARRDPVSGHLRKQRFGPWMYQAFRILAKGRRLRGTRLDPFGYTSERRLERQLVEDYRRLIKSDLLPALTSENHAAAVLAAEASQAIKGFGHVKQSNVEAARIRQAQAMDRFRAAGAVAGHNPAVLNLGRASERHGVLS